MPKKIRASGCSRRKIRDRRAKKISVYFLLLYRDRSCKQVDTF